MGGVATPMVSSSRMSSGVGEVPADGPRALGERQAGWTVEPMQVSDLEAVLEIGRLSFPAPWSAEVFHEEMARGWACLDVLRRARGGRAIAYSNYWQVADELHLLNVATHPEERRGGCASLLLEHMLTLGRRRGFRLVTLEVRRSNEVAQRLYRRFAFRSVGVRPSYYADNQEDAVVMTLELRG